MEFQVGLFCPVERDVAERLSASAADPDVLGASLFFALAIIVLVNDIDAQFDNPFAAPWVNLASPSLSVHGITFLVSGFLQNVQHWTVIAGQPPRYRFVDIPGDNCGFAGHAFGLCFE